MPQCSYIKCSASFSLDPPNHREVIASCAGPSCLCRALLPKPFSCCSPNCVPLNFLSPPLGPHEAQLFPSLGKSPLDGNNSNPNLTPQERFLLALPAQLPPHGPLLKRAKTLYSFPIHKIFSPTLWLLFLIRTQSSKHGKELISPVNSSSQHEGQDLLEIPLHSWTPKFPSFLRTLGCWVSVTVGLSFSSSRRP